MSARLAVSNLGISYGAYRVVRDLNLEIGGGEIVGLLGSNGSGKSTTVKVLTGINQPDSGSVITFNGDVLGARDFNAVALRRRGIRVVHQESPLVDDLTVAEAIAIHIGFPKKFGVVRVRELNARAQQMLDDFEIPVDAAALCGSLTAGQRALTSFTIALAGIQPDKALLILDEATASLPTRDAERYLRRVREAARRGLSVLMVTHRLSEVRDFCDRSLVLRNGENVAEFTAESFDESAVVHAMVGGSVELYASRHENAGARDGAADLSVSGLFGPGLEGVSLTASSGQIVGITGLSGGGASEVLRALGGIEQASQGTISIDGREVVIREPRDAIDHGVYYLSSDRIAEGGVMELTVEDNLTLPKTERYGWGAKRGVDSDRMIDQMGVHPTDPSVGFGSLSGGNQQKVLMGRWLLLDPKILLLDDPTAGVDPNAREAIFAALEKVRASGGTVLIRSTEPAQLARLCDVVLVFRDGQVIQELRGSELTTEEISLATYA
ncbi:sugar ABC transporter ATP-binding protein [Leifsonia kafniensis]|uniref:Sugar ABC transporter ATP-binding protein n=1 Tax=Leifsonia kafniensis TaxID=475957 RepID=A0ABP7KRB3_9MICO